MTLLCKIITAVKSEEVKTGWSNSQRNRGLAESYKDGYDSKWTVLLLLMMIMMMYEVQQTLSASNITNHYSIVNRNKETERAKKPSAFFNSILCAMCTHSYDDDKYSSLVRYEFLAAVTMNNTIFWVTTPYSLVETYVLDKCSSMCL
jgi:hypothetical protein